MAIPAIEFGLYYSGIITWRDGTRMSEDWARHAGMDLASIIIGSLLGLVVYFAPSMIARSRRHPSLVAIRVLNLLLGWTFLGWVVSLVWAYSGPDPSNRAG